MIDPHHIWNVIYNARSNRHHPPTSPNTAPATQNESHDWSISHMKRHLECAEQQSTPFNLTKYCACHAKWISWLIHITYETSFTMRGATGITLQPHQIRRLPRKMNLMIDPHHIWNIIYNAQSNRHHPATSPNTAPATQKEWQYCSCSHMKRHLQCAEQQESPSNLTKYCACHAKGVSWLICITYETSFTMRGATGINLQPHQILRLPRKIALPNLREIYWKQVKWHFQCATDPSMIRAWSDHDPSMIRPRKRKPQPAAPQRLLFALARSRFYWQLQRFPLRLSFQISPHAAPATKSDTWTSPNAAPATKSDTWTSPNAAPATKSDTWPSRNGAPATKSHTWTSPNAAPATPKECHDWSASHMKRHLQCAKLQASHSNLTKHCACHAKWISWLIRITYETSFTMRGATGINLQPHQILRLPRKMNLMIDPHHIWNVIYNARSNRHQSPTSPNTAPTTQNCTPKS